MQKSRWDRIYDLVYNKFGIIEESVKEIEFQKGVKGIEETLVFISPKGKMKLSRLVKPKLDKIKYHYFRRTSHGARQELHYSSTETVEIIKLYCWNQQTQKWEEVNLVEL